MNNKEVLYGIFNLFKILLLINVFLTTLIHAITLEEAVVKTLNTNPGVKERERSLDGVKKEKGLALSAYYPKLDISIGAGIAKEKNTPSFNEQSGEQVSRTDNSIVASMNIFNGLNTYYDVESQSHRADSAKSSLEEFKTSLAMQTIEGYITMMKQKAILHITKENVFAHQEIYNKLKEYTDSGMGKSSDLRFASGRLTLAEVNAVVFENNFIQSKVVFETTIGGSVNVEELEEPSFDYILPNTLEEASFIAISENPSIKVGEHNIKSAYSNYKRSQSTL